MPIIVLNLTNMPINSATSNAGFNYSVHNSISPKHYYIHDTVPGTKYDIRIRWALSSPAYESDVAKVASIATGVVIGVLGLALAPFTAGMSLGANGITYATAGLGTMGLAMAKVGLPLGVKMASDAVVWKIADDKAKAADDIRKSDLDGAKTTVLVVKGTVPFKTVTTTKNGQEVVTEIQSENPNRFPLTVQELDESAFNTLRGTGQVTQSRIPILADLNALLGTLDANAMTFNLPPDTKVRSNRRYWIENYHPKCPDGLLSAADSETDCHFYRRLKSDTAKLPESQWQLVPYEILSGPRTPGDTPLIWNIFAICERRYGKFLCFYKNGAAVQMRRPLEMEHIRIDDRDGYMFDVDFGAHPSPRIVLTNGLAGVQLNALSRLDWTPFFALIPGPQNGYFHITPFTPQPVGVSSNSYALYTKMKAEGPFIVGGEGSEDRNIATRYNHNADTMDQWRFVEVVD
jgi:hypothetical protein